MPTAHPAAVAPLALNLSVPGAVVWDWVGAGWMLSRAAQGALTAWGAAARPLSLRARKSKKAERGGQPEGYPLLPHLPSVPKWPSAHVSLRARGRKGLLSHSTGRRNASTSPRTSTGCDRLKVSRCLHHGAPPAQLGTNGSFGSLGRTLDCQHLVVVVFLILSCILLKPMHSMTRLSKTLFCTYIPSSDSRRAHPPPHPSVHAYLKYKMLLLWRSCSATADISFPSKAKTFFLCLTFFEHQKSQGDTQFIAGLITISRSVRYLSIHSKVQF